MITSDIKEILDGTGIKVAGWVITGTIVVVGAAFLYIKYIEARKLKVDYMISQYQLQKEKKDNPDFRPQRSFLKKII
ncbi:MAG: hypothetical protein PHT07_15380 [Paludibacter sp.]|nr:hypothetical protein [Paludibacter sp.]